MTELHCDHCGNDFASEDETPRCPKCLRKSSIVDPNAPRALLTATEESAPRRPFWPRFAVALPSCTLLFFGLVMGGSVLRSFKLSVVIVIYASLLGGLLLALSSTLLQLPGLFRHFGPYHQPPPEKDEDAKPE